MTKAKKIFRSLTSESICEIYNLLHEEGIVSFPITEEACNKIDSIVANINGKSFGVPHYKTLEQKVTAHLYFIINDHAFTDGNKRTAVLVFSVLCRANNLVPRLDNYGLDELAVYLEQLEIEDYHWVIKTVAETLFKEQE